GHIISCKVAPIDRNIEGSYGCLYTFRNQPLL
ncbi:unnamed protein product, partial [Rotaria sp. Silwood2]